MFCKHYFDHSLFQEEFAGAVARASCRVYRDIESLRGRILAV